MKCNMCDEDADYHQIEDGKDIYLCWKCAKKKYNVWDSWSRYCQHCCRELDPKTMYIMKDQKDPNLTRSYCSLDCAMKDLEYEVLD